MRNHPLAALLFLTACTEDPGRPGADLVDTSPETSPDPDIGPEDAADTTPISCPRIEPARLVASEGELIRFSLAEAGAAEVDVGTLKLVRQGDDLVGRAPWTTGLAAEIEVVVSAPGCPSVAATLAVQPMQVSSLTWPAGQGPEEREHPIFWVDPTAPNTLVVGSGYGFVPQQFTPLWDLWTRDLSDDSAAWVEVESTRSARARFGLSGRVADGPGPGPMSFYVQGGEGDERASYLLQHEADGWTEVEHDNPPLNQLHAFVRIAEGHYLVALGLLPDGDTYTFERRVLHLGPNGWAEVALADPVRPSPRYGFAYAWDAAGHRLIAVSGARAPTSNDFVNAAPDTWVLSVQQDAAGAPTGALWSKLETEGETPRLRNGCWAFDPDHRRLFVFGGTADGATAVPGLHILELEDEGARWVHLDAGPDRVLPPPRSSCAGAWDAERQRFIIGFGNAAALYRDLWFFDF